MKKRTMFCIFLTVFFIVGCSIPVDMGRPVSLVDLHTIDKGMTSQQVKVRLGEPMTQGRDNDGNQTWSWYHLRVNLPAKADDAPEMQRVTITLDSDGLVLSVAYDMSKSAE